jgi:flagellar biosynthetic protein FlhB
VTRSRELSGALSMSAVAGVIFLMGRESVPHWTHFFRATLDLASTDAITPNGPLLFWTSVEVVRWVFPIVLSALAVSVVVGLAQGGFVFAPEALAFQFERLSPASKLGQIFSPAGLSNILKSLLPFGAIAWIGAQAIRMHWNEILGSSYVDSRQFTSLICRILIELFWKSALVLLLWAGMDYLLLWWKSEGDLKMSRQDLRDEYKETQGNPQMRSRIRGLQRQMRRRRVKADVAKAAVVLTNPTHYAVALGFDFATMEAPKVVAKGRNLLAEEIKAEARWAGVPILENPPLARSLYRSVEVGQAIPVDLYAAVATILAYLYRQRVEAELRQRRRSAAPGVVAGSGGVAR